MLGLLHSYFTETKQSKPKPNYIYRDELDKKTSPSLTPRKIKKRAREGEAAKPLIQRGQERENRGGEKGGIKVRVLMTKSEAARLLSKCRDGGVLEFKDVARELVQIPKSRVSVVDCCCPSTTGGGDGVLASIPEEF